MEEVSRWDLDNFLDRWAILAAVYPECCVVFDWAKSRRRRLTNLNTFCSTIKSNKVAKKP